MPGNARHSLKGIVPPNEGKGKPFVAQGGSPALLHFSLFTLHSSLAPAGSAPLGLPFSNFLGANQRPRRGRSAGPPFSAMRKRGKNRQRRGLPPPCGIHPAVRDVPAFSLFRPLARWGHIDGMEILRNVPASLEHCTSIARASPWCATVPSCRKPGSR